MSFYSELIPKFQNLWNKEKTEILKLKLKDCTDNGESFNGQLKYWDVEYYIEKILVNDTSSCTNRSWSLLWYGEKLSKVKAILLLDEMKHVSSVED